MLTPTMRVAGPTTGSEFALPPRHLWRTLVTHDCVSQFMETTRGEDKRAHRKVLDGPACMHVGMASCVQQYRMKATFQLTRTQCALLKLTESKSGVVVSLANATVFAVGSAWVYIFQPAILSDQESPVSIAYHRGTQARYVVTRSGSSQLPVHK